MTRKLQLLLTTLLLTIVGATGAWADKATIYPKTQMGCRIVTDTSVEPSSWKYNNDASKLDTLTASTYESTYRKSGFFILEEWDFTDIDVNRIKSITITYTTKESQGARIWIYGSALPAKSTTAPVLAETMNTVMGAYPGVDAASTMEGKSLANGGSRTTVTTNVVTQDVSITGSALATLKESISGNKIVFVTSTTANALLNFYTFESDDYKPKMVIEYYPFTVTKTVNGVTTTTGYESMTSESVKFDNNKTTAATIDIYDNVNMGHRIQNAVSNLTVNVVPHKNITITNTSTGMLTFLVGQANATLNVGNNDYTITVKNSNNSISKAIVECSSNSASVNLTNVVVSGITTTDHRIINAYSGSVSLKDVTFTNCSSTSTTADVKGIVHSNAATVSLENISFNNCSVTSSYGLIYAKASNLVTLKGTLTSTGCTGYDLYLNGTIAEDSFTPAASLSVYWVGAKSNGTTVVTSASSSNATKYTLTDDYELGYDDSALKMYYYVASTGGTKYTTLEGAVTAASDGGTVTVLKDYKVTSRIVFDKSLAIEPNTEGITVTIDGDVTGDYYALGLATASKTVTIGSSTYAMTIDGNKNTYGDRKLLEVGNGQVNLLNLTIKDAYTSSSQGIVCAKISGKVQLTDIAFNGCQSTNAATPCIVFNGGNDQIILSGNNTFTDCTADLSGTYTNCNIYLERRVKIDAGISNTTPIRIYAKESNIKLGNPVATQSLPADEARFFIMNKDYACYSKSNGSSRADLTICEGKTLDVTAAEAATLVLPFAATIPEGVSCYMLSHTDRNAYATATPVEETTLPAKTPVLIYASEGSYKFRNSSKATTATSIPGSPSNKDALTGVYSELAFTSANIASDYRDVYILNNHSTYGLGFYKAADGKKVGANRCYLTATNVPDAPGARLSIVFDEEETTGIENLTPALSKGEGVYFDLSGRRVAQPTKGLYIVNGKKVVIK